MPHDSRPNEVHRGAPVRGAATGCLVAASVAVGLLLLLPGLCTLVVAANAGLGPSIWVIAIVAIIAGLALLVGALRIMFAPRQLHGGGPPVAGSPAAGSADAGSPAATARPPVPGAAGPAPERTPPQPQDVRDIGGGLILFGLVLLLILALLVMQLG